MSLDTVSHTQFGFTSMRRVLTGLMVLLPCVAVQAELVRFEITERVPFANGHSFGEVGPYE